MPREAGWAILLVVALLGLAYAMQDGVAGGRAQSTAIGEAVPGFVCPGMQIDVAGGRWSSRGRSMASALVMPQACVVELKRRIRSDRSFSAQRCNLVEKCWQREDGTRTYTFSFYPDYTGFRFSEQSPTQPDNAR